MAEKSLSDADEWLFRRQKDVKQRLFFKKKSKSLVVSKKNATFAVAIQKTTFSTRENEHP